MQSIKNIYEKIYDFENLHKAWEEARKGKRYRDDVLIFNQNYEEHLINIQNHLIYGTYEVGRYHTFYVYEPKKRLIMSLPFKDRIVQWAIYRQLFPIYEKSFIYDSYACRRGKGTHKAADRLQYWLRQTERKPERYYYLKMDISKYFYRVDHDILLQILGRRIKDKRLLDLLAKIINSESTKFGLPMGKEPDEVEIADRLSDKGMPIGNLTSQMFANIYLNEVDQYAKHTGGSSYTDLNPTATRDFVLKTYQTAVELFAYLCKLYNLDPLADGVIISHAEGHKRGIASNHGDVEHIWNKQGLTMAQFRKDIKKAMGGTVTLEKPQEDTKTQTVDGYKVKITTGTLNVRKGPGTNYGIATTVKKGEVYTIVGEAKNGSTVWGKLKSGAGYISLDYTEKLTDGKVTQTTTPAQNTGSYKVKVTADVLNVRKGPGTGYGIATTVKQGEVYTIVDEVKSGNATWGKLKSGAGYISLAYTKRV